MNPCVFIVGCPRSGTTLLQRMLDAHPQLAVANDSHFIPRALEAFGHDGDVPLTPALVDWVKQYHRFHRLNLPAEAIDEAAQAKTYARFVEQLYDAFARVHGKSLGGEKTPDYVRHLPVLRRLFPSAKFVHIIRDGRDVALSTLEWATDDKGPGKLALWKQEPVAVCALWWRWQVRMGLQEYRVKYEELVERPEEILRALAGYLEMPFAQPMVDFAAGKTKAGTDAKKAWLPATAGLRDWRTQMDARSQELFEALAGDLLTELGYERRFPTISPAIAEVANRCAESWNQKTVKPVARLAGGDVDIIARDKDLPGLATVLDSQRLSEVLKKKVTVNYVRYKPGQSCIAGFTSGYAKAFRLDADVKLRKAETRRKKLILRKEAVAIALFPTDSELTALRRLPGALAKVFKDNPELWDAKIETLRYKPERRYVGRVGTSAVIKFYLPEDYAGAKLRAEMFESCGPLRLAKLIGHRERRGILAWEWIAGRVVEAKDLPAIGAALAQLHAQPAELPQSSLDLMEAAATIGELFPALKERAQRLAGELKIKPDAVCTIHGDFNATQVVMADAGTAAILDLDRARRGDPAEDLGNFIAHWDGDPNGLLDGYGADAALRARVKSWVAAQLFRAAAETFRLRAADWPSQMEGLLERAEVQLRLPGIVRAARVVREKPQRRRLIEYVLENGSVLGKVRVKGPDAESYRVQEALWKRGGCVPEPLGTIPESNMWLQRKVAGISCEKVLTPKLAGRIAEAIHWVHEQNVPTKRTHTMADELRILQKRLGTMGERARLLLPACERLALATPANPPCGIHRDFYHDHVLVDDDRLWLVDFDLYSVGDPALDIGNFWGHLIELGMRRQRDAVALAESGEALAERFVELAGQETRPAIEAYTTLTVARHVWISTQFVDRQAFTGALLDWCEHRLQRIMAEVRG